MKITKRDGRIEELDLNKIVTRVRKQSEGLRVDADMVATKTIQFLTDNITSSEIDKQLASVAESYSILHPDYNYLAGRLANTALHKDVPHPYSPSKTWLLLKDYYDLSPRLDTNYHKVDNAFNEVLNDSKEHEFDYQGVRVIANQYSFKVNGKPVETPDLVRFRVAYYLGIDYGLDYVKKVFRYLRQGLFTFATPINLNSGLKTAQLASCFLIGLEEDSYEGIMNTQQQAGNISRHAGGIGMHISNLRAKGSLIKSSGAKSAGIQPFMKLTEANANYWNQGGKRKGSYAIYLEPWHADVFDFIEMRSNQGLEANRARDLFYALWIPDLFMRAVEVDKDWYLFCPSEAPGLSDTYGECFNDLYNQYVEEGKYKKKVKARELWDVILSSQIETGLPYIGYKDTVNKHSMQKNIGVVKSSNLCVHGDSQLLTDKGYIRIGALQDKEVTIWNGEEWSKTTVRWTGFSENSYTVEVKTKGESGIKFIHCTDYHKFPISIKDSKLIGCPPNGSPKPDEYEFIPANRLRRGMKILTWDLDGRYIQQEVVRSHPNHFMYTTFCLTEPKRNMMVVNGILTGNCAEIVEVSNEEETAVCNLANINLPLYTQLAYYDKEDVVETIVRMLNVAIDLSYYPDNKTRKSNLSRRPLGIGVQGLAEAFVNNGWAFDSPEALRFNHSIFAQLYLNAVKASKKLVKEGRYHVYEGWLGSVYEEGKLHYDLYEDSEDYQEYPIANSLLIALMPTVTTSQLLGNTESFEPFTSLIYRRRGMVGDYTVVNRQLVNKLSEVGLWTDEIRTKIIDNLGSIQNIEEIPDSIKQLFKTVWEIDPKKLLDLCIDRQPYVDQAQSMNLFIAEPNKAQLTQMLFYGWKNKLKTGMYYLRSRSALKSKKV